MVGRLISPRQDVGGYLELRESFYLRGDSQTDSHRRDLPLLPSPQNMDDSIKTLTLSNRIKALGFYCGIPGTITSYCFRHMVAQQLQRQGGKPFALKGSVVGMALIIVASLEEIRNVLTHAPYAHATKSYLGRTM